MLSDQYISVSDLNGYLKTYLENNYFLQEIFIKGEISNFKRHQSGTFYFAIKDATSRISVVMFPLFASRIRFPLKDGDMVLIKGKLNVYEAGGSYSIHASEILFDSIGMLYVQYEELKKKLDSEGLFSVQYKKPLPKFPKTIAILTAPYGAAIHDMVKTLSSRWPLAKVILFPCLVQGKDAARDIVKNIQVADNYHVDVMICGRGGGSIEDLWPFNEEIVARAIFACQTPIISAVGHQNDYTIADFVADVRALTPTDGAVKATPDQKEVLASLLQIRQVLVSQFHNYMALKRKEIERLRNSYVLVNPIKIYENNRYKIDELESRLENAILKLKQKEEVSVQLLKLKLSHHFKDYLANQETTYRQLISKLDSLSPLKVLNRGYSFATLNHKSIKSILDVKKQDEVTLEVSDGKIYAIVKETERKL